MEMQKQLFVTVAQGATNTFTFDNPTSVYKSQIIVDEFNKQNWGVKIEVTHSK